KGETMFRPRGAGVALATLVLCGAGLALRGGLLPGGAEAGTGKPKGGLEINPAVGQQLTGGEKKSLRAGLAAHTKADPKKVRLMGARLTRGDRDAPQNAVAAVVLNYDTHKATRYLVDLGTGKILETRAFAGQPLPASSEREDARRIMEKDPK